MQGMPRFGTIPARTVFVAFGILAAAPAATAQTAVSRIALVAAFDARNRPLTDLSEDDFVIREGGAPREILSIRLADYPIVLLLDDSAGAAADFDTLKKAAARFVARIGQQRAVVIGALTRPAGMLTAFEDERETVRNALDGLAPAAAPAPRLLDSIAAAAGSILATRAPFSAIVIVSGSRPATPAGGVENAVAPLVNARITVHAVGRAPDTPGGGAIGTLDDALRVLSERTRGDYRAVYSAASFPAALDGIADRLASEIMVEFIEPPGPAPGDDVKVGVRIPGAKVTGLGVTR
jgi:hypothetical protein